MATTSLHFEADEDALAARLRPRDDVLVAEERTDDGAEPGRATFSAVDGPYASYDRELRWEPAPDGGVRISEAVRFRPAMPFFWPLYVPLLKRALRNPLAPQQRPWWVLPDRLSPQQSTVVAVMCVFHVVGGMLYAFLTNLLTFASADLGDGTAGEQSVVLVASRIGVVLTIATMALADRAGRRRVAIWSAVAAAVLTVASAFSPDLVTLAVLQTASRNLAIAAMLAADTLSVEEIPAGSRAAANGLGALSYGLGAGVAVVALPLADLGDGGWRLVMGLGVLAFPLIALGARHLRESGRFLAVSAPVTIDPPAPATTVPPVPVPAARQRAGRLSAGARVGLRRFVLVGSLFFLLNAFVAPSSQLQNDYLRADRGFSGARITLLIVLTSAPGFFGILIGGRLADRRGRRLVMLTGLVSTAVFGAAFFVLSGAPMWMVATVGAFLGTLAVPALGVLAPELFPTARRGAARGALSAVATSGSVAGLLIAGALVDSLGYGTAFVWLAAAPLAAALIATAAPETAGRELEELNEDRDRGPTSS